jgi:hypothetical protein
LAFATFLSSMAELAIKTAGADIVSDPVTKIEA